MNQIKRIIDIFRFLRKARKQILPNFDELKQEVGSLKGSMGEISKRVAALHEDTEDIHDSIKIMETKYNDFKDVISLQNQLIQILLGLLNKKE